jgi:hypothetical protein
MTLITVSVVILAILGVSSIAIGLYGFQPNTTSGNGVKVTPSGPTSGGGYGGGSQSTTGTSAAPLPTSITILETMNVWNSTAPPQPSFFVLGGKGLENSSIITVPAHKLIQLTIISYDTPTPGSTDQQGMVTGTVGGNVLFMNGTLATMGTTNWSQNITSVPGAVLAHTFTIQQLGINIPVVGGSTVIAYLEFDKVGTYIMVCLTPCGFGPNGDQGAMSASGWMLGQLIVQ